VTIERLRYSTQWNGQANVHWGDIKMEYHMRRQDRELKKREEIDDILKQGKFVVLALCHDNEPYSVTLSYGYEQAQNCLYLHTANEGLKLDFLRKNPSVCATVVIDKGYIYHECGHEYESVVLRGNIEFVTTLEGKRRGVQTILHQLEPNPQPIMQRALKTDAVYKTISVLKLVISSISGKKGR
jgi:nitroimidazol reductase NimA-like FMN-containing flavoprotein (pyridoxamine 5'-phosphate oxidase superfamily)